MPKRHLLSEQCLFNTHEQCGGDALTCDCIHHLESDLIRHYEAIRKRDGIKPQLTFIACNSLVAFKATTKHQS